MNLKMFAESLTIAEINELTNILYDLRISYARRNLALISEDEMLLIDMGYFVNAIKAYKLRVGCDLLTAKLACDMYRDSQWVSPK